MIIINNLTKGFEFKLHSKQKEIKPKAYEIAVDGSPTSNLLQIKNVYSGEVIASGFRVADITVDGTVYPTFEALSGVLADVLFNKGGGSGDGGTGDYIPLSGTEVGKPVTGDIKFTSNENETLQIGAYGIEDGIQIVVGSEANYNNLTVSNISTSISCVNNLDETSIGIIISQENGIQIKENNEAFIATEESHITSKKYADLQHSYSTEEIKTGGTWIDGKPIYRKVFIGSLAYNSNTVDTDLLNIETRIDIKSTFTDGIVTYTNLYQTENVYKNEVTSVIYMENLVVGAEFFPDDNTILLHNYMKRTNLANGEAFNDGIVRVFDYHIIIEYTKTTD